MPFGESILEQAALAWLEVFGLSIRHGLDDGVNRAADNRMTQNSRSAADI